MWSSTPLTRSKVLPECMRVLCPNGSCYLIIPYDLRGPDFRNNAHFWKVDEISVRRALQATGFEILRQQTARMSDLGISGAYLAATVTLAYGRSGGQKNPKIIMLLVVRYEVSV
jgi:hypothetical protein